MKHHSLFRQIRAFAQSRGVRFLAEVDLEFLRAFRHTWKDGGISAQKKGERVRAFFRFVHESDWLPNNPAHQLKPPKVRDKPTLPFTQEEMMNLIAAAHKYRDLARPADRIAAQRAVAVLLLLRYTGMRISDTVTCAVDRLQGDRVFLYTQKTGVPINVPVPPMVVEELKAVVPVSTKYFFWSGMGDKESVASTWRRSLKRIFRLAGVCDGHPHRFRDTFAVEQLLAGTPIEQVAILLGHSSIRVTEKHYAPWVSARQAQLEANLKRSWMQDPIVLAHAKGTSEVHIKEEKLN